MERAFLYSGVSDTRKETKKRFRCLIKDWAQNNRMMISVEKKSLCLVNDDRETMRLRNFGRSFI